MRLNFDVFQTIEMSSPNESLNGTISFAMCDVTLTELFVSSTAVVSDMRWITDVMHPSFLLWCIL